MTPIIKIKRSSNRRLKEEHVASSNNSDEIIDNTFKEQNKGEEIFENNVKIEFQNIKTQNNNFEICINYLKKCSCFCISVFKFIIKVSGVYILWIILHFVSSHLYIHFCVPSSFIGFIISPFMTSSPHCQGLRWIIYNGANTINNMWVILGTWICSYLIQLGSSNRDE